MPSDVRVSEDPTDGAAVRAAAVNLVEDRSFQPELNAEYRRLERARQQMARHAERVDANRGGGVANPSQLADCWVQNRLILTKRLPSQVGPVLRFFLLHACSPSSLLLGSSWAPFPSPSQCGTRSDPSDNPLKRLIGEIHRRRCWSPHLGGLT